MHTSSVPLLLVITNTVGDIRRFWLPLIRQARTEGFRICCAVPNTHKKNMATLLEEAGLCGQESGLAELRFFPMQRKGMNPWQDVQTCYALWQILRQERPQIVLAATIKCVIYGGLAQRLALLTWPVKGVKRKACFFAAITGLGYAFEANTPIKRVLRSLVCKLYRIALRRSAGIFFQNWADVDVFCKAGIVHKQKGEQKTSPPLCITAGVGVDLCRFQAYPLPPLPPKGPLVFLLVARLLYAKGIKEYFTAAHLLQQRLPTSRVRFLLLGPLEQGVGAITHAELDEWLAQGAVEYLGAVADVRPVIKAAHVLVLPSWREGRPTVIMEGFAMARPAVVSDVPGCRETLRHGVDGLLIPPHDVQALANTLETLILAPDRIAAFACAARDNAERFCDASIVAKNMLAFMQQGK